MIVDSLIDAMYFFRAYADIFMIDVNTDIFMI
jgi:hypothetical protein